MILATLVTTAIYVKIERIHRRPINWELTGFLLVVVRPCLSLILSWYATFAICQFEV